MYNFTAVFFSPCYYFGKAQRYRLWFVEDSTLVSTERAKIKTGLGGILKFRLNWQGRAFEV
jgi:hypothetical protein